MRFISVRAAKAVAMRLRVMHMGTHRELIRTSSPVRVPLGTFHIPDREELQAWEEAERERDEAPS